MPYVVTQSCCSDGACVVACPVNAIHPTPGEPGFAEAEMLYVDPKACVDCGACMTACPVDALQPHTKLTETQLPFIELNAEYYRANPHPDRPILAAVSQRPAVDVRGLRVAVVGAGPAGLYAADELLKHDGVSVDVFDRLPTPHGLARYGVAPDHPATKQVIELFGAVEREPGFRYRLDVEVGTDITHEELRASYDAVLYAVGAATDRRLDLPGEELPGSASATDFVAWYNGHPDHAAASYPLDTERAVVIGNGNVALDVARILTADPERLAATDIADPALAALRHSRVREVVVIGRRGPAEAAFTLPELVGLAGLDDVDVVVEGGTDGVEVTSPKTRILAEIAARPRRPGLRRIVLRFTTAPTRVVGNAPSTGSGQRRVEGLEVVRTTVVDGRAVPTDETEVIEAGLVLRAVGYRARPVAGLPFDDERAVVPNDGGRVEPGTYVAGWIKRGPTGFLGTNKSCSQETVAALLADADAGLLRPPRLAAARRRDEIDSAGWQAIDSAERHAGELAGRPRVKLTDRAALRAAAAPPAPARPRPLAVIGRR